VTAEDVYGILEELAVSLWDEAAYAVAAPFERLTHRSAMERFGTDKPDTRHDLEIVDVTYIDDSYQWYGLTSPWLPLLLVNYVLCLVRPQFSETLCFTLKKAGTRRT